MRRKISLFIGGMEVDLQDETFLLFNYTMEDMSNPTTVRNSYSQQITVKGTPQNNKVFGHIWKVDRDTQYGSSQSGVYFDPTQKTSFTIYNEMNEILESGYCKLDQISRTGGRVEYKISLFGGLGSFMYGLAYDGNGNRKSLADLKFTGQDATDNELNFTITRTAVKNAWKRLGGDTSVSSLWDIINFAPAYNGLPGGTFDADKAVLVADNAGLPIPEGYSTYGGRVIASLPREYTEWEVHDLRSYLQRPVLKVSALIGAICEGYNNGGYTVSLDSSFFSSGNPYYADAWITLPLINSLEVEISEGEGNIYPHLGDVSIPGGGNMSTEYEVNITLKPELGIFGEEDYYYLHCNEGNYLTYLTYTALAYDSENNVIQEREVTVSTTNSPLVDVVGKFDEFGGWVGDPIHMSFTAPGISKISLARDITATGDGATPPDAYICWSDPTSYASNISIQSYSQSFPSPGNDYSYLTSDSARSGTAITKRMLLNTEKTPADYLLSYCKMFGLVFLADKTTKRVSIMLRGNFYRNEVVDLTRRINEGAGITMQPYTFDARWYSFGLPYDNGQYAKYYANIYDRDFGVQRVNTGYAFNAETRNLLEGTVFRGACEVMENSKCYADITDGTKKIPAVFQDSGGSYSLYDRTGKAEDFDLPLPSSTSVRTWWNSANKTYDFVSRVQFHDADNSGYEERDTILFFNGMQDIRSITSRIALTDDNAYMMALNNNTPCWILDNQLVDSATKVEYLPRFSRYKWNGSTVEYSLDFGTPGEVQIPDVTFADDNSIYMHNWQKYIRDRYDDDSRVMTCKVDLSGFQVNEELLRQFYWYDGSVWALNRIINHSLSTWDDTECEFVKVQDIYNY